MLDSVCDVFNMHGVSVLGLMPKPHAPKAYRDNVKVS
jgi:hypothetical protein